MVYTITAILGKGFSTVNIYIFLISVMEYIDLIILTTIGCVNDQ